MSTLGTAEKELTPDQAGDRLLECMFPHGERA